MCNLGNGWSNSLICKFSSSNVVPADTIGLSSNAFDSNMSPSSPEK